MRYIPGVENIVVLIVVGGYRFGQVARPIMIAQRFVDFFIFIGVFLPWFRETV